MLRATWLCISFAAWLSVAPVAPAHAQDAPDETLRVYDLRDLALLSIAEDTGEVSTTHEEAERVVNELGSSFGVDLSQIVPGVYVSRSGADNLQEFTRALDQYRKLRRERFAVTLQLVRVEPGASPALGAKLASAATPLLEQRQVLRRRVPAVISSVSRSTYVARLTPTMAESAAGYETVLGVLEDGLRLTLVVGAGTEAANSANVAAAGTYTRGSLARKSGAVEATAGPTAAERGQLQVDLPTIERRTMSSDLTVEFGQPTVLAVVDGFEVGERIALVISVTRLP